MNNKIINIIISFVISCVLLLGIIVLAHVSTWLIYMFGEDVIVGVAVVVLFVACFTFCIADSICTRSEYLKNVEEKYPHVFE